MSDIPRAILDALELGANATRGYVLAAAERVLLGDDLVKHDRLMRALGFTNAATPSEVLKTLGNRMSSTAITYATRTAPQEEREVPTTAAAPTGMVPATIIGILGLAADASAADVLKRISKIEGRPRADLTTDELNAMAKVREALALPPDATTDAVIAALSTKLGYVAASSGRLSLVFADRHRASARADMSIAKPILKALGLPDDAEPSAVLDKIKAIEDERKRAATEATNEAYALEQLRNLLGLPAGATDDDVVVAIKEQLQTPAVIDAAVLSRKLTPSLRGWAETFAAKQGVAELRKFIAMMGPHAVRSDEILADLTNERIRWTRGRLDFSTAMHQVTSEHPELTAEHVRVMQLQTRTSSSSD